MTLTRLSPPSPSSSASAQWEDAHYGWGTPPGAWTAQQGHVHIPGTLKIRRMAYPLRLTVGETLSDDGETTLHSSTQIDQSALGVNLAMPLNRAAAPLRNTVEVGADVSLAHCGGAVVA